MLTPILHTRSVATFLPPRVVWYVPCGHACTGAYCRRPKSLTHGTTLLPQLTSEYHNSVPVVDSAETGSLGPLPVDSKQAGASAFSSAQARAGSGSGATGGAAGAGAGAGAGGGAGGGAAAGARGRSGKPTIDDVDDEGLYFFRLPNCQARACVAQVADRLVQPTCGV